MTDARATFLEFFAGGGMARLGLAPSFDCAFANDVDAAKCAAYRANFGDSHLQEGDIAWLCPDDLPTADLAWASFPCQDLSLAGTRAGLGAARSGTFWAFWSLIEGLDEDGRAPATIVLENVPGLLTSNGGADFRAMAAAIVSADYRVGALILDAADHVPQSRARVFVVAHRGPVPPGLASAHVPLSPPGPGLEVAAAALPSDVRSRWLWWTPPPATRHRTTLSSILERDIPADTWRSDAKLAHLLDQMPALHRARVTAAERSGGFSAGAVYRRMRAGRQTAEVRYDGLAGCLRTLKGGSSRQLMLVSDAGRTRLRPLLAVEGARLMGLPENYRLPNGATAAFNLLGDGVCVPVVSALTASLLVPLAGIVRTKRANWSK